MRKKRSAVAMAMLVLSKHCSKVRLMKWVNSLPGHAPSREEKRLAVKQILADRKHKKKSSREIARLCGVSHTLVEKMRSPARGNISHKMRSGNVATKSYRVRRSKAKMKA